MILFNSDYLEGCHPEILKRLQEANLEQTQGYGADEYCEKAREVIRELCSKPDADVHFLVGGTQTNSTVISSALRPYQGVLCAESGHINVHETGAIEHGGHKVLPLPAVDGKVSADSVLAALKTHFDDADREHLVQPGMLYISFPTELGTLYSRDELFALKDLCSQWGLPLFIDGARLGYGLASSSCDVTIQDLAQIADVFYIGGTKQGALFGEAVVITNDALKKDFRYCIKQEGAMLAKGRLLGIQFDTLLRNGLYFSIAAQADALAERIRKAFSDAGFEFFVESHTNQQFPILTPEAAESLSKDFGFELWDRLPDGRQVVRFCTSWATSVEQVDALIARIEGFIS